MRPLLRSMPPEVRALRQPWPSQVGRVRHLTGDLERRFRAGQRVTRLRDGHMLGGSMKGGSSSVWIPVGEREAAAYEGWARVEGFEPSDDRAGFEALSALCASAGIELRLVSPGGGSRDGPTAATFDRRLARAYAALHALLGELPPQHLGRAELRVIELGGWGQDCAKASAYRDGVVQLYDFALRGARRTFVGLALHELGHAQEHAFGERERRRLAEAHAVLARGDAFFPIEFLMSASSRVTYQRMARSEFVAETYLAYTACGAALRTFALERAHGERDAWQAAYAAFRDAFGGAEYA